MLLSDSATITTHVVASDDSSPLTSSLTPYAPVDRITEIVCDIHDIQTFLNIW